MPKFKPKRDSIYGPCLFTVREVNAYSAIAGGKDSFVLRARFALEWLRDSAPDLGWGNVSFTDLQPKEKITLGGRVWMYLPQGHYYDDDPWNERNLSKVWVEEGS